MSLKAALVLTTINDPRLLNDYLENFKKYGYLDNVEVFVIPDNKTPECAYLTCKDLEKKGLKINFVALDDQEKFLNKFPNIKNIIPYNSDNRRNIGYLLAYAGDFDFLISIDDDNYPILKENYFAEHSIVCSSITERRVTSSADNWFNICNNLEFENKIEIYPRGFPYYSRHKTSTTHSEQKLVDIKINAGLWINEPDLDGITWLSIPAKAKKFSGKSVILSYNTWSPINTQNTALHIEVIPSYYFVKMGYPILGAKIDRYGDIFSGYFSQKCAKELGHSIRIGSPIAEHRRNSHNYLNDATNELACIWILEELLPWMTEIKLEGNSYYENYEQLSHLLEIYSESINNKFWLEDVKGFIHQMAYNMRIWLNTCKIIRSN